MPGHTVLITGAGFSKAAGGPLLHELLSPKWLDKSEADPNALDILTEMMSDMRAERHSASLEDLFTLVWREARTGGSFQVWGQEWGAENLLSTITAHLISVCGAVHIRRGTYLWTDYASFLIDLVSDSKSLTILTFNYDLLMEQLLDDIEQRFTYSPPRTEIVFGDSERRRQLTRYGPDILFLKLHGSSNWGICRGCQAAERDDNVVTALERPYNPPPRKRCPWCNDRFLEPGIIPPISGKAGELRHMDAVWKTARKALRRAREILVVGYSLPPADQEAFSLMKEAELPGKRPRITVVCGPRGAPASYGQVFARYRDVGMYFEEYLASPAD